MNASNWELVKKNEKHDVVVYYRTLESGHIEFKGVTHIKTSLNSFVSLIDDVTSMPEWVDRTIKVEEIKHISDKESYARTVNVLPFPFKNRDSIIHSIIEQDINTFTVIIKGKGEATYIPDYKCCVRMTKVATFWKFIPKSGGMVEVVFQGYGEPGGNIPTSIYNWLCKIFLWELPYNTLIKMKDIISQNKYHIKKYHYIKEPKE